MSGGGLSAVARLPDPGGYRTVIGGVDLLAGVTLEFEDGVTGGGLILLADWTIIGGLMVTLLLAIA